MSSLSVEGINELRRNARSVVRELGLLNDAYFEIGVTLAERHLLIELITYPSSTMGEISLRLLLDKSTVSRLIANAVKKDYVKCVIDEKDKRKRFLVVTEKGRQVFNAVEPIAFNQTKEALLTLTKDEVGIVHQGIALYAKGLKSSRVKDMVNTECQSSFENIESLSEIYSHLNQLGYTLDLYHEKDEKSFYEIFKEVIDSGSQFPFDNNSIEEFRKQFMPAMSHVYVCRTAKGEVIGGFYLKANYSGRASHIANAGYMIRSAFRGKGVGSLLIKASLQLAKDYKFQAMQFNMVLSQNKSAVKLYEKLGFTIAGTIPEAVRNCNGSFQDGYVMYRKLDDL